MGWLDDALAQLKAPEPKPVAKAVTPRQPKTEIKTVWFQTRSPRDGDQGEVEAGFYSVADDMVTMRDDKGVPTGKTQRLGPGEDARQIAGRLARAAWVKARGETDFNRPLGYARGGYA